MLTVLLSGEPLGSRPSELPCDEDRVAQRAGPERPFGAEHMRCEVLAIGTELLLGQIVDTNSAWIGEQLAASGIDSYEHRVIGDNQTRIVEALRDLLVAQRRGAHLRRHRPDPGRPHPRRDRRADGRAARAAHGARRAHRHDVPHRGCATCRRTTCARPTCPRAASRSPNPLGTAPGLCCPVGDGKVVYAVPGVPYEMQEMVRAQVIPDLLRRSGEVVGDRVAVAEDVGHVGVGAGRDGRAPARRARRERQRDDRVPRARHRRSRRAHHGQGRDRRGRAARSSTTRSASCARSSATSCSASTTRRWSTRCSRGCKARGWTLGVAESVTGGLIGGRIASVPGASETFRGTIGAYATDVKRSVLGVTAELVVSEESRGADGQGAQRVLGADVGIAVTGVAGPTEQDGVAVGTVCFGIAMPDGKVEAVTTRLPGDRERVRQFSTISLLNLLRQRLDALP